MKGYAKPASPHTAHYDPYSVRTYGGHRANRGSSVAEACKRDRRLAERVREILER